MEGFSMKICKKCGYRIHKKPDSVWYRVCSCVVEDVEVTA